MNYIISELMRTRLKTNLPVDVQPIKAVFSQEIDRIVHELAHSKLVGNQFLERF